MDKNCYACTHSYMEPDSPYLICGHRQEGPFGKFIYNSEKALDTCEFKKFEQHPLRNEDGSLKSKDQNEI